MSVSSIRNLVLALIPAAIIPLSLAHAQLEFDPPVTLDTHGEPMYMWEDIAVGQNGVFIAIWASGYLDTGHGNDGDIFNSRSPDGGATWSAPALLNTNGNTDSVRDYVPTIATDGFGTWIATWAVDAMLDGYITVSRSLDDGLTWSDPILVPSNGDSDNRFDYYPELNTDENGTWILTWDSADYPTFEYEIYFSRSTDNGLTWSASAPLNTNATIDSVNDTFARLATDGAGKWIAVWQSSSGPTAPDIDIFSAQSTDNGATWSAPALLYANAATDTEHDIGAVIATDRTGVFVVVWTTQEDLSGDSGSDADLFLVRSTDNGSTWSPPELLNSTGTSDDLTFDYQPTLATDGDGAWTVVWSANGDLWSAGPDREAVLSESRDDGATWSVPRLVSSDASTDDLDDAPRALAVNGDGTWIVIWAANDDLFGLPEVPVQIAIGRDFVSGGDGSSCFIATAAFGTPLAQEINALRSFRDRSLLTNVPGAALADAYYRLSPPIARNVAEFPALAGIVRVLLTILTHAPSILYSVLAGCLALILWATTSPLARETRRRDFH